MQLAQIVDEVKKGMDCDLHRRTEAHRNLEYYRGKFELYRYRLPDSAYLGDRCNRASLLMQKVINVSTSHLYRDDPVRTIKGHPEATQVLQKIYKFNDMCAKWQAADRLTWVGDAVAFQVAGTSDPKNPIKIHLWAPHSFSVFVSDDDPLMVEAVVTIDRVQKRKRWTLYTAEVVQVYMEKEANTVVAEEDVAELVSEVPNHYGVLPFAFAHYETPVIEWWSGSPGCVLREINDYVIYRLTDLADGIRNLIFPKLVGYNVDPAWKPPQPWLPGIIAPIPGVPGMEGSSEKQPRVEALSPPLGFVEQVWLDIDRFINHSLECAGIPEAAIRMVQSVARSGSSIAQEQAPLVNAARMRQRPFLQYETGLAKVVLQVLVAHSANNRIPRPEILAALEDFELSLRWAEYYSAIPGPERDRADAYAVQNGYKSKKMIAQERYGYTDEESDSHFEHVQRDHEEEAKLLYWITDAPLQSVDEPNTTPVADSNDDEDLEPENQN